MPPKIILWDFDMTLTSSNSERMLLVEVYRHHLRNRNVIRLIQLAPITLALIAIRGIYKLVKRVHRHYSDRGFSFFYSFSAMAFLRFWRAGFNSVLRTYPYSALVKWTEANKNVILPGAGDVLRRAKRRKIRNYIISFGSDQLIINILKSAGLWKLFDGIYSNQLVYDGERIVSTKTNICAMPDKLNAAKQILKNYNLQFKDAAAVGDGPLDIELLNAVGYPVVKYNPVNPISVKGAKVIRNLGEFPY
ncbi:MAG: HAD family hydrolase [archaeon]